MNLWKKIQKPIEIFSSSVCDFFDEISGEPACVRSAFLLDDAKDPILWNEYNGLIQGDGDFTGTICFSASRGFLSHALLVSGEGKYDEGHHFGLVGKILNQFMDRARLQFGNALRASSPKIFERHGFDFPKSVRSRAYAVIVLWRGYEAGLVVNLEPMT